MAHHRHRRRHGVGLRVGLVGAMASVASLIPVTAAALISVTAAPAEATAPWPASARECMVPHGAGPGYNASIGNKQNGKTVCVTVGEKLLVILSVGSPNGDPWHPLHLSKQGVLKLAPLTLMLSRGLTPTNFEAARPGVVRLSSERSPCGQKATGVATCDVIEVWQATVIVRSRA